MPICVLFCQQETCAWAFFVQVYIEEYETAMGFGGGFFCLFGFFSILSAKWVESSIPPRMARLRATCIAH